MVSHIFRSLVIVVLSGVAASAADWITAPSHFTHDPRSGDRVDQYAQVGPYYYYRRPDYVRSGYRHTRSSIRVNGNIDNLHLVEEWGRQVRPYGEWQRPYRPYSVPYSLWGAPFAGAVVASPYPNYGPAYGYGPYPQPPYRRQQQDEAPFNP